MSKNPKPPPARQVGRPRVDPRPRPRPAAEEILWVASRLFAQKGFAATSTREIAEAAGLRQPSLFHHYATKEAILERLLQRSLDAPLEFVERQARASGSPALRLYRSIRFDVRHLCSYPFDLTAVVLSPELRAPRFRPFWARRARLIAAMQKLIRAGIRAGQFERVDAALATEAIFGMGEATLAWYRRGGRWTPDDVAEHVAGIALRSLLAEPAQLTWIRAEAGRATPPARE